MNENKFTWVETHKELTEYLSNKENSQKELIELLKGVGISPFNDKEKLGEHDIELDEIDPFTFFCYIYKYGSVRRLNYLQKIAEKLNIIIPKDELGIPSANAQKVWLFPYKYKRTNNEILRLWNFFKKAISDNINDEDFADILSIENVAKAKITEALFNINPNKYFPINGPTKPYLINVLEVEPIFNSYSEYLSLLENIKNKITVPFYELSYQAWVWNNERNNVNYWIFQGNPKIYDVVSSLNDGLLETWTVKAHVDKIKIGDKIILWVTGKNQGCYGLGEVISDVYEGFDEEDQKKYYIEQDKNEVEKRVKIRITINLSKNPISKVEIENVSELNELKIGNQGTNFAATEDEYLSLLKLLNSRATSFENLISQFNKNDLIQYTEFLKEVITKFNLKHNDQRLVFSIRDNRLNFIIGQRYCLNLFSSNLKVKYGVISKTKLLENSLPFDGSPPQPYYNYFTELTPNSTNMDSMIEAMEDELSRTKKSSFRKYNNEDFENFIFSNISENKTTPMNFPLNTIFYGPPGTGKTYNTILRAAEIIENRKIQSYQEALKVFKDNLHNNIEFITFHQNYSYEDFIQGLRPDIENDSQLTFERKDGVFKLLADKALKNLKESEQPQILKKSFEEVFNLFFNPLVEGEVEEIEVKMKKVSYFVTGIFKKSIDFRKSSGGSSHTLSIGTLKKMYSAESVLEIQGLASYYTPLLDRLLVLGKDSSGKKEKIQRENYVIIIDEINRANISRVFGELITLIEPDKRSGGAIPLEARLPSGDTFIVPSNLYIIGTMNTADKSIALLDIALRRRFEFEAMYPLYDIEGPKINNKEILQNINLQIIKSKGHDFQIGHAYFMGNNFDLIDTMNKKVIPLLLEYYMNDEKEVKDILYNAGLLVDENAWPLKINGKRD